MGRTNIGGLVRNFLTSAKACCTSGVHWNLSCFFRSLEKGIARPPSQEMKWLSATMQHVSFCTSFKAIGEFIMNMSLSFSRLASMPRYDTMKSSSFPEGTPKTHFSGFNFHLKCLKFSNISDRSDKRSSLTRDLMMTTDDDIIDVCFHVAAELIMQAPLYGSLIGCACVLQPERHRHVAVGSKRHDE